MEIQILFNSSFFLWDSAAELALVWKKSTEIESWNGYLLPPFLSLSGIFIKADTTWSLFWNKKLGQLAFSPKKLNANKIQVQK